MLCGAGSARAGRRLASLGPGSHRAVLHRAPANCACRSLQRLRGRGLRPAICLDGASPPGSVVPRRRHGPASRDSLMRASPSTDPPRRVRPSHRHRRSRGQVRHLPQTVVMVAGSGGCGSAVARTRRYAAPCRFAADVWVCRGRVGVPRVRRHADRGAARRPHRRPTPPESPSPVGTDGRRHARAPRRCPGRRRRMLPGRRCAGHHRQHSGRA